MRSSHKRTARRWQSEDETRRRIHYRSCFKWGIGLPVVILHLLFPQAHSFVSTNRSPQHLAGEISGPQMMKTNRRVNENRYSTKLGSSVLPPSRSFEDRMKEMVVGNRRRRNNGRGAQRKMPRNVKFVETLEEYKEVVGKERKKLVAVRFFAPWCKACKAIQPLYYRMAQKFPNVVFVEVPVTESNANLHQGLGVETLPFGHIYHPTAGLVEELRIARRFFPQFAHKLQSYVSGSCEVAGGDARQNPFEPEGPSSTADHPKEEATEALVSAL